MNVGRILKIGAAAGIVYNLVDSVSLNYLLGGTMASMAFNISNDFIAALVLAAGV